MQYAFSGRQKAFAAVLLLAVLASVALSIFYGSQYVEGWRAQRAEQRAAASLERVAPPAKMEGVVGSRMRSDAIDLLTRQMKRLDEIESRVLAQLGALSGIADRVESQHVRISEVGEEVADLAKGQSAIKFTVDTVLLYTKPDADGDSVASVQGPRLPSTPRSEASARRLSFTT